MQHVRFEGGIEDTRFGADLFDADFRLKRIGMGLLDPGVPNLKTYWAISLGQAKAQAEQSWNIGSRFWFYPVLPSVAVREDVAAIRGLKVAVFTEILSAKINGKEVKDLSTFHDRAGDEFSKEVSKRFSELSRVHRSFARLQGLDELVALTRAIEEMDKRPDFSYWLKEYRVKKVKTKRKQNVLKREQEAPVSGSVYQGHLEVSGGVQLTAIALRLKAGDVTALKQAVLKTRPSPNSLTWTFVVGKWLIPTAPGMLKLADIAPLFAQALFLQNQKRYDEAIAVYTKVIERKPDWSWPYNNRGLAYYQQGNIEADECCSLNEWLAVAPQSVPLCGTVAAMVSIGDLADRAPRALADEKRLSLGSHSVCWYDTPHLPHAWECGFLSEERTSTMLCGDLFTQGGDDFPPVTESDILGPSEAFRQKMDYFSHTKNARTMLERLSATSPTTLACMHGSA